MKRPDFTPLQPKVVLGVAAHPDDLDYGAAGTMAVFAGQGAAVHYVIVTDGSKGSPDPAMSSPKLVKLREQEQRAALDKLGGGTVHFLGYPDGELEVTLELKKQLVAKLREIKPDVVITMDPAMLYSAPRGFINHPDHRAAGQATLDAVFPLARDHLTFPELYAAGLAPHITPTLLLVNFDQQNFAVDITDTLERKLAALSCHASQISDPDGTNQWVTDMAKAAGRQFGYGYAEGFMRIDID